MVAESLDSKDKNRRHRLPITPPLAKFNKLVQKICADGGIGRHEGLKIPWPKQLCGFKSRSAHQNTDFFGIVA